MKICKYCNSPADDTVRRCKSCGAAEFAYKCENCATVFSSRYCPSCGVKAGTKAKVCQNCGERYFTPACPNCGYGYMRFGWNRSAAEATPAEPEKRKTTVGTVLLWIFFWPIMLLITVWKSPKLAMVWKVLITCLVLLTQCAPYIWSGFYGDSGELTTSETTQSADANGKAESEVIDGMHYFVSYQHARAYTASDGNTFLQGIVEVTNNGTLALSFSGGSIAFQDSLGNSLAIEASIVAFPNLLLPEEKGYLYCQTPFSGDVPAKIELIAKPELEATLCQSERLTASNVQLSADNRGDLTITGMLENTTASEQSVLFIAAILLDRDGEPVALVSNILTEPFEPDEVGAFEIRSYLLPKDITVDSVSSLLVYAFPAFAQESLS